MAPATGFEPTISGLTSRRFKPLSYAGALVGLEGVEPPIPTGLSRGAVPIRYRPLVVLEGVEPSSPEGARVLKPLRLPFRHKTLVHSPGFEPGLRLKN
ncbi:hypothetical protein LCGC14_2884840 [marine sediment metagenome]|uniref:Uncharacterized protein n=1 Tax=marine sediment metagenome TaxID=412755 RepID=A0A0F9AQ35_9ZZZZ